jgi:sulfatase maturation enzyme AslB (radical SAM superfamily)
LAKEILAEGYDAGYRHLHVTGGEPLLWEGLWATLDYALDLGYKTIFMNTNGTLLTEAAGRRLAAYDGLGMSVSLEGSPRLHDQLRGQGSCRQAMLGLEAALAAGIEVCIFTTVCKDLLPTLAHFADDLYNRLPAVGNLILIPLINIAAEAFPNSKQLLDPDDFIKLVRIVALLNLYGHKTHVLNDPLVNVVTKWFSMSWTPRAHPPYRQGSIIIMASGNMGLIHSSKGSFGRYTPGMIAKVLASDDYRQAVAPDNLTCPFCNYTDLCLEGGMRQPTEPWRDMLSEVPYCKRVLDRIAG